MLSNRVSAAGTVCSRANLDALVVTNIHNIRYLTGFAGTDAVVVLAGNAGWFLIDSRYAVQAGEQVDGFTVTEYRRKFEETARLLLDYGFRRVGFEDAHLSVAHYRTLGEALSGVDLVPLGTGLDDLRAVKEPSEIDFLRRTAEISSGAFRDLCGSIRPGMSERELALQLEWAMRSAGVDGTSFNFIVASGPRGALPHGTASDRAIGTGELVTVDFGGIREGYCSDETVTVAVGSADTRQREVYQIVKDAHDRAIERVRPGVACREVDAAARDYIEAQGFGACFGHGVGHGVGLEVHEKPVISPRSGETVEEGMVFTIEPGIYIPGWGGVRIEDTVVVTRDGCIPVTQVPKGLMVL